MFFRRIEYSFSSKPKELNIQELKRVKQSALSQIKNQYPHVLISNELNGKIAYLLRPETPDQVISTGGFVAKSNMWLSPITGDNQDPYKIKGSICLSLLPEITTIFLSNRSNNDKRFYIYALPLENDFVFLGGQWRQIISPGALPLPLFWRCREVLKIEHGKVNLGPILGDGCDSLVKPGEKYFDYLNDAITMPKGIGIGEDYPEIYEINDTAMTQDFQYRVNQYYQQALYGNSKKCEL